MGEREVIETVEVTDEEEVHICDFCGRSSDEFAEDFNYIYTNPNVTVPRVGRATNKNARRQNESGTTKITFNRWKKETNITVEADNERHYCDECHKAHVEVHNDDN